MILWFYYIIFITEICKYYKTMDINTILSDVNIKLYLNVATVTYYEI